MKKTLALLLVLVMVLGMFPSTTMAAATEPNVTITVDKTTVEVGDTITVKLGITQMNAASIAIGFYFDNTLLEATSVTARRSVKLEYHDYDSDAEEWFDDEVACTAVSTKAEANASGYVGAVWAMTHEVLYYEKEAVVTVTFKAIANGTVEFLLKEDSSGTDGYKKDKMASGITVTIGASEPSCEHPTTKVVSNDNATHNVVCADTTCGAIVTEDVTCTGTDDGNCTTAVTCVCGNVVTAAQASHTGGTATCTEKAKCAVCGTEYGTALDHIDDNTNHICDRNCGKTDMGTHADGDDADHTCDYCGDDVEGETCVDTNKNHECDECGADVGVHKSNAQYTCLDGICEYCNQTIAATTEHTDVAGKDHTCDVCGTENVTDHTEGETVVTTTPSTCTEGGSVVTETFCTKCGERLSSNTEPIPPASACVLGDPAYTWADDYSSCTAEVKCQNETVHKYETVNTTDEITTPGTCTENEVTTYTADFTADWAVDQTQEVTGEKDPTNHAGEPSYVYVDDHSHNVVCGTCDEVSESDVPHTYDETTHECECGAVETFTLTITAVQFDRGDGDHYVIPVNIQVPYGAKIIDYIPEDCGDAWSYAPIYRVGDKVNVNDRYYNGAFTITGWQSFDWNTFEYSAIENINTVTMPAKSYNIYNTLYTYTGWLRNYYDLETGVESETPLGSWYLIDDEFATGWTQIDGAWYYFDETTDYRAEGLTRAPYPTVNINGWTYEADAETLDYCESKGKTFIDATEAWFYFDEDGKFTQTSGIITFQDATRYLQGGILDWHPGLIIENNEIYYFIGDETNGGNIAANGDTYITRNNDVEGFAINDIYNFNNGKLSGNHGIVDGKYYENSRLMTGNGLTKVGENYIYVRFNGCIVVDAEYYVPANDLGIVSGTYTFDANGFMVDPELTTKNGIVEENGGLYFYENGKLAYNKGLIEYNGGIIYVRSNGQLAVGKYYVTNLTNYDGSDVKNGDKVTFGADGYMVAAKSGIVDGYYYVNNQIAYNAGVVEIQEGVYIYVRSTGEVVMGRNYWITNVGNSGLVAKQYTFDENGVMLNPEFVAEQKNGIVDGYYYENGKIVYCAGLIEYNGGYIYVRSNGMVATGKYWITNTNGLMDSDYYIFGEDGMMIS